MKNLSFVGGYYVPNVDMNAETGICVMSGECMQLLQTESLVTAITLQNQYEGDTYVISSIAEFFVIIKDWLSIYVENVGGAIEFHFNFVYFDTSSSRQLLELLLFLQEYQLSNKGQVSISWHYEEASLDILEEGEMFAEDVQIPFTFVPYQASMLLN